MEAGPWHASRLHCQSAAAPLRVRPRPRTACALSACAIQKEFGKTADNEAPLCRSGSITGGYCRATICDKALLTWQVSLRHIEEVSSGACRLAKVLVIEDDEGTAEEIVTALGDRGYVLDRAANGADGLHRARVGGWDVLVVDRMLPELDGLSVIEALRSEGISTPVLVLSALNAVNDRVRGLRAGGDDYLAKPFALSELAARLEALLRRPAEPRATLPRVGPLELDLLSRKAC